MLGNLGFGELLVIVVLGLLIFGPERLPGLARDAAKMLQELRAMATGARAELRDQLGPEVADLDLQSLQPRRLAQKILFEDDPAVLVDSGAGGAPAGSRDVPGAAAGRPEPPQRQEHRPHERAPFDPDAT